jgi:hypothetical protein
MLRPLAFLFLVAMFAATFAPGSAIDKFVAQATTPTPGPLYWYYNNASTPSPYPSAWAAINGAFGAGNIYDTGTGGFFPPPGLDVLYSGMCNYVCFGERGSESHHALAFGSDYNSYAFTHQGSADDHTVASIWNQLYNVSTSVSKNPGDVTEHYLAIDDTGNLGVQTDIFAGSTVVAGQANTNPYPSPTAGGGSLISHTGAATGELLLGDSSDYVRCDYGETTTSVLTCNVPVTITAPLMAAESATSSTGPVPPAYKQDGTPPAASMHIVKNINPTTVKTNGSCSPNTWCNLSGNSIALSSAAEFASTNYSCALSSSSSYKLILMVNGQTTTGFTIRAYYPAVLTIIPDNTNLGIQYECSGE